MALARQEGYVMVDDRAGGGALFEAATLTCAHCNCVQVKNPKRTRPRGHCAHCDAYVCDNPACRATCLPFWEMIAREQTRIIHEEINRKLTGV